MEKKKMTNKKKFWIGMSSLAAVGIITATVAYFISQHTFEPDNLKSLGYNVTFTKLLDSYAVQKMVGGQELNADVTVANNGETPILARITYKWTGLYRNDEVGELQQVTEEPVKLEKLQDLGFEFGFDANNNFEYGSDNKYYYKGIIENGNTVKHIDTIKYNAGSWESVVKYTDQSNPSASDWSDEIASSKKGEQATYIGSDEGTLTVVVETVQATNGDGVFLTEDSLKNGSDKITAAGVKNAWSTFEAH